MHSGIRIKLLSLIFLGLFLAVSSSALGAEDRIIAIVNGDAITQRDAEEYLNTLFIQWASQYDLKTVEAKMKEAQLGALGALIENQLILQEAKSQGLEVNGSEIEAELAYTMSSFDSEEEFRLGMQERGLSIADIKKKLADRILTRNIIQKEVRYRVFVQPKEVTKYYQENIDKFNVPEQVQLDTIFVPIGESKAGAKKIANKVVALLKKGEDFKDVQKKYSALESLGLTQRGNLKKEIQDALLALDVGDVSSPIDVEGGFFIIRLKTIIPEHLQELSEVQEVIHGFLFQKKFEEKFVQWIDELKKKALIIIK